MNSCWPDRRTVIGCLGLVGLMLTFAQCSRSNSRDDASTTPRAVDGKPDLSGVWVTGAAGRGTAGVSPDGSVQVYLPVPGLDPNSPNVFKQMDSLTVERRAANPNKPKYHAHLLQKVLDLSDLQAKLDPAFFCKLPGIPRMGPPSQIVQAAGLVVFLYGDHNAFRVIPTDGRPHRDDVELSYLGDSVGHWEGDTLVVEADQFIEDTWLGSDGYFHSPAMRVIERLRRDGDTLHYSVTVEDPEVLAEPWNPSPRELKLSTNPVDALVESPPCIERDSPYMTTNEHH